MHHHGMKDWIIPWVTLVAVLIRWCVGLGSYSGQNTPPMFGDYEAQRHWMELTIHLPVRQWYTYDLQYWGLDYPPLTAYISWLCGKIGSAIDPPWFALDKSRGIETSGSKVYMRSTVLIFDLLVYFPAIILFTKIWQANRSVRTQHVALITLLLQPALIIIDFGHFQYNSVMLGFALLALDFFASDNDLLGALCFVLSLGFKQMALYYAPAIGSYLIAKCLSLGLANGRLLFFRLAVTTLASFIILFLPFLPPFTPLSDIMQPIIRIFPFARGLFEDKVANFWCATNVVFKWKFWVSKGALVKLSTLFTAVGFLPSVLGLIYSGYRIGVLRQEEKQNDQKESTTTNPLLSLLPYALLASSMSFFLFSFQVHEKTILVPLLPLTLLMSSSAADSVTFELGVLANNVAMFSIWPLLQRDGLGIQYIALTLLWNRLIGYNPFRSKPTSFIHLISLAVYAAIILLHIAGFVISPPSHLPDLFPVLNVLISTPVFTLVWLWSIKRGVEVSWAMGTLSSSSSRQSTSGNQHSNSYSRATSVARSDIGDEVQSATSSLATPVEFPSLIATKKRTYRTRSLGFARGDKIKLEWEREKERERVVSLGPGAVR
ncbi:ALG6, ALG8 glycosyltransferase family-domain-containing protein [Abortiporus biennis]|nr:ALG6, ALG8 glycosyltransferase family-domain-containing protein [Abortiporus biennis]